MTVLRKSIYLFIVFICIASISTAQNIGIGTANPQEKLHVQGGTVRVSALTGTGQRLLYATNNGNLNALTDGAANQILTTNGAGVLSWQNTIASVNAGNGLIGGGTAGAINLDVVATNGLTTTANDIRLGGALVQNTTITQGTSQMIFNLSGTGNFNVQENGVNRFQVLNDGRVEMEGTTDASGAANTGVLEIANALRLDGDEIITNTNSTLFMQNDNNGDLRVDNTTFMVDASANRVGIATTAPTSRLDVVGGAGNAVRGRTNGVGGYLGYETDFNFNGAAYLGAGLYVNNNAAGYSSIYATQGTATNRPVITSNCNDWIPLYTLATASSAVNNPNSIYAQLNVTNATLGGQQIAIWGYNNRANTAGNPGYAIGVEGTAYARNEIATGVVGYAFSARDTRTGGYFDGSSYGGVNQAYAYVAGEAGSATNRKIIGTGSVSEVIPTPNNGRVTLTCPESPEYWYQDYGSVTLVNGKAHVELDPILADIIVVDNKNPIRVFCTPVDMPYCKGVTIANRTTTGFDIVELNGGNSSGIVDYQIIVKPKTNYGEGRFPQAPGPLYLKSEWEPQAAKAANQPDKSKIFRWAPDHVVYKYNPEQFIKTGDMITAGPNAGKIKLGNGKYGEGKSPQKTME